VVARPKDEWSSKKILDYPPFCLDSKDSYLVVSGGGGESKTGIPNELSIYKIKNGQIKEAAFMDTYPRTHVNIRFHPKNDQLAAGTGNKCCIYTYSKKGITLQHSFQTDFDNTEFSDQKFVFFTNDDQLITGGTDGNIRIWKNWMQEDSNEKAELLCKVNEPILTAALSQDSSKLALTSKKNCQIWTIKDKSKVELTDAEMEFNGCGFIGSDNQLVTALSKRKQGTKLVKWDIATKKQLKSVKVFNGFHHTSFATSPRGEYVAVGSVKGTISVYETNFMSRVMTINNVHNFIITGLHFVEESNPNGKPTLLLVSIGADKILQVTPVKHQSGIPFKLILAIIILLVAVYFALVK
jgi:prolactin regulatory element-binding protein